MGEYLDDFGYSNDFLDKTPKAKYIKELIDKLDFIKIRNFCSTKDPVRRMKSKPQTGRKYFQKTHLIKDCHPKYRKNT